MPLHLVPALLGLVWPVACPGCGRLDVALCPACRARVTGPAWPAPVDLGVPCFVVSTYAGIPARLIVAWKERGQLRLTGPFAEGLAHALAALGAPAAEGGVVVVPVPSSRAARRRRGADPVRALAQAAARRPGAPPARVVPALRHGRRVRDQAGLDAARRRVNLHGAFTVPARWRAAIRGRPVVVVDDIVTTGATVNEAVRALTSNGAQVRGICCLSVTLRRQRMPIPGPLH